MYVTNIYNWIFIIRKSLVSQLITISLSIFLYVLHYSKYYDDDFAETSNLIVYLWLLSFFLMNDWQWQLNEYLNNKITLSQNEFNLNSILEQFPSSISFYNMTKGYFYNNKILNYKKKILTSKIGVLERKESLNRSIYQEKVSRFKRLSSINEANESNEDVFRAIINKQNPDWSLQDEIESIFCSLFCPSSEIYDQEDLTADFLDNKNDELNEYEITTKSGRFEFCIKYAKLCVTQETQALMIVINDLSENIKHRETQVSERMKTIMLWSLSHEIRSPLHQVNGMLSLIQPKLKDPEQLKYIKIANSSSELLRLKIEDILCYYEVETKTFKKCHSQFNVRYNWLILESLFMPLINSK